jgi:hypothetical protein
MALLGSLSTAVSIKKIKELAETDQNREKTRDLEDEEGLGADADVEAGFPIPQDLDGSMVRRIRFIP